MVLSSCARRLHEPGYWKTRKSVRKGSLLDVHFCLSTLRSVETLWRKPRVCAPLTTLFQRCHWRHASLRILVNSVQEVLQGTERWPGSYLPGCCSLLLSFNIITFLMRSMNLCCCVEFSWYGFVPYLLHSCKLHFYLALSNKWHPTPPPPSTPGSPTESWIRWIIFSRQIRVSWVLGHWQIRLLNAVAREISVRVNDYINPP